MLGAPLKAEYLYITVGALLKADYLYLPYKL